MKRQGSVIREQEDESDRSHGGVGSSVVKKRRLNMIRLVDLKKDDIPIELRPQTYFSFDPLEFAHYPLLLNVDSVFAPLENISSYIRHYNAHHHQHSSSHRSPLVRISQLNCLCLGVAATEEDVTMAWLHPDVCLFAPDKIIRDKNPSQPLEKGIWLSVGAGCKLYGGTLNLTEGPILLGDHVVIETGTVLIGPLLIDNHTTLRTGTYLRGNVVIGKHVTLRAEVKNAIIMDRVESAHPGYIGDSILGYKAHLGNQVTTSNVSLLNDDNDDDASSNLSLTVHGSVYDTGRRKIGVILGDHSQLGCSTVTDPATLLRPHTVVYPLTRLPQNIYGPYEIIKNKPLESGVVTRVARRH